MKHLFYHSKPEADPFKQGKRTTIAAILVGDTLSFGAACTHKEDFKKFVKKTGRGIAIERAENNPIKSVKVPDGINPKNLFVKLAKELALKKILVDLDGQPLTKDAAFLRLAKMSKKLDKLEDRLEKQRINLVEKSTELEEYYKKLDEFGFKFDKSNTTALINEVERKIEQVEN